MTFQSINVYVTCLCIAILMQGAIKCNCLMSFGVACMDRCTRLYGSRGTMVAAKVIPAPSVNQKMIDELSVLRLA